MRRAEPQQPGLRMAVQQLLHRSAPLLRAAAVELVQNDVLAGHRRQRLRRLIDQAGVGAERHMGQRKLRGGAAEVLRLRAEDVFRRGQPEEGGFRVLLDQTKGNVAFACPGGENHSGAAFLRQHPLHGLTDLRPMGIQLRRHATHHPSTVNGRSIPLLNP